MFLELAEEGRSGQGRADRRPVFLGPVTASQEPAGMWQANLTLKHLSTAPCCAHSTSRSPHGWYHIMEGVSPWVGIPTGEPISPSGLWPAPRTRAAAFKEGHSPSAI